MGRQAERWGSELLTEDVEVVDLSQRPFLVRSTDTEARPCAKVAFVGSLAPARVYQFGMHLSR